MLYVVLLGACASIGAGSSLVPSLTNAEQDGGVMMNVVHIGSGIPSMGNVVQGGVYVDLAGESRTVPKMTNAVQSGVFVDRGRTLAAGFQSDVSGDNTEQFVLDSKKQPGFVSPPTSQLPQPSNRENCENFQKKNTNNESPMNFPCPAFCGNDPKPKGLEKCGHDGAPETCDDCTLDCYRTGCYAGYGPSGEIDNWAMVCMRVGKGLDTKKLDCKDFCGKEDLMGDWVEQHCKKQCGNKGWNGTICN